MTDLGLLVISACRVGHKRVPCLKAPLRNQNHSSLIRFHIQESENQPIRPWRVHDALISHSSGSKSLTTCSLHAKPDEWRVFCNPFALHPFTRPSRIEITIFHKKKTWVSVFFYRKWLGIEEFYVTLYRPSQSFVAGRAKILMESCGWAHHL